MSLRVNFSPGPSALPAPVRERIGEELDDWQGLGTSVMEISHRGAPFAALAEASEERFRRLLGLAPSTQVLFLQGGASSQFALVPLNLARLPGTALYATDGHWGQKALAAAATLRACAGREREGLAGTTAPYVHVTSNETVDGLQWFGAPIVDGLVAADLSSDIASAPMPFDRYDIAYAGAQKNLGIAGLTLVLVSERALAACRDDLPPLLSYQALAASGSMANTPPTFAWYVFDLVVQWIEGQGGLAAMERRNRAKAEALYRAVDASALFHCDVPPPLRSRMNVVFRTTDGATDARFLAAAGEAGFVGLKGHRAVGGLRASLYNAVGLDEVRQLLAFMAAFERDA